MFLIFIVFSFFALKGSFHNTTKPNKRKYKLKQNRIISKLIREIFLNPKHNFERQEKSFFPFIIYFTSHTKKMRAYMLFFPAYLAYNVYNLKQTLFMYRIYILLAILLFNRRKNKLPYIFFYKIQTFFCRLSLKLV